MQGEWDSHNVPTLEIPHGNLRAEFWVEPIEASDELSPHMIYVYVSTDQVRFYRDGAIEPLRLADVPPLVFSEVMRDVDLFVGVASVANDPTWGERTDDAHFDYWQSYALRRTFRHRPDSPGRLDAAAAEAEDRPALHAHAIAS